MSEKILIIEDEARMRRVLQLVLETQGYLVETAADGEDGILKWKTFLPDLVFTDLKMPKADGMEVLKYKNQQFPHIPLILLTAFGTIPAAVDAMKLGAFDYISKPIDNEIIIEKAKAALLTKAVAVPSVQKTDQPLLIGSSQAMVNLKKELALVASTNTSVFITGESGTGKELAARMIHSLSARNKKPFVRVNCAAIPRELLESELFGHIKGAFTGAVQNRTGAFIQANSGTLFLDEIGELPYEIQAKLLHAVEDRVITPVGSTDPLKVDIKIICATNQNIEKMLEEKKFRSDLYFRLNTYTVSMPSLKERQQDIPELAEYFLNFFSKEFGQPKPLIQTDAMKDLFDYDWPGNVRELKNVMERLMLVSKGKEITAQMITSLVNKRKFIETNTGKEDHPYQELFLQEKKMIDDALTACGWNISKAARQLGITRNTLRYRIKKHDLSS